jgi:hypothetical protein|tara:strand:- start:4896 stop:5981 length:1086 start_codon:yes stop_codon:yes gene_type:complete
MTNNIFSINLNGYDWSNLYHVDYSGGSGGEYLTELIANKAGAKASSMIKDTPEGKNYEIMDSINNQYATPYIHDYAEPFLLKGHYNIDTHDIRTMGMNIKLWDYYRFEIKRHLNNLNDPEHNPERVKSFPTQVEKINIARMHRCTHPLIVRTHYNKRDYEQLKGIKSLWMYPATHSQLVAVRMFLRRHLNSLLSFDKHRTQERLGEHMFEWFKKRYDSGTGIYYQWQLEQALKNKDKFYNNEDFDSSFKNLVDTFMDEQSDFKVKEFRIYNDINKDPKWRLNRFENFINATDWVFGFDEEPFNVVKKVTGFNIRSELVQEWQDKNKSQLTDLGIKFTATQEECKDFILNYYKNNNIKVKID